MRSNRRRNLVLVAISCPLVALLTQGAAATSGGEVRVTQDASAGSYVRYDGDTDAVMAACSTSRRQQNEPSVAVDPRDPNVVVAGANDYCAAASPGAYPDSPLDGHGWMGYYRSVDGGATWRSSLVPGYPTDTSPAGLASPTRQCTEGSDPSQAFDNQGRLFYAFICYNRDKPQYGGIYVATYSDDGATYRGTVQLDRGTPSLTGAFNDKPNLVVDTSGGPTDGNVYVFWGKFSGTGGVSLFSASSTDHGQTFKQSGKAIQNTQGSSYPTFSDASVGPHGEVYGLFNMTTLQPRYRESYLLVKSTDAGRTFGKPVEVATFGGRNFAAGYFAAGGGIFCGSGPYACPNGWVFPRFQSTAAVAADGTGVHVVWNQMLPGPGLAQSKVFARSSPNGVSAWSAPAPLDTSSVGHQFLPDMASADGTINVVFYDSRHDPGYAPDRPPGLYADGSSSGPAVDTVVARSTDGGATWTELTASSAPTSLNYLIGSTLQVPFFGDYIYISAVHGAVQAVWTSERDVVPGDDLRQGAGATDGFHVYAPCTWVPNDVNAQDFTSPGVSDPCFNQGGKDSNIYTARF